MYVFILLCTPTMPIWILIHCMTRFHYSLAWWQEYSFCTNAFLTTYNPDTYITSQKLMVEQKLTKRFTVLLIRYGQKLVFSVIKVAQVSPPSFPASIFARIWKQKSQNGNKILLQLLNNWKMVKKVQFSSQEQRQGLCLILTCFLLKVGHVCGYAHFRCK